MKIYARPRSVSQILGLLVGFVLLFASSLAANEKELEIGAGEIRLDGAIGELKTSAPQILIDAKSFTLPSGKSQTFSATRKKAVILGPQCWIHVKGESATRLKLSDLKLGEMIIIIGRDSGGGQPLQAREIAVQRKTSTAISKEAPKNKVVGNEAAAENFSDHPELVVQMGSVGTITEVAVSPDGKFLATELYSDLGGHGSNDGSGIRSLAFSPRGKYLVSGAEAGPVKVWNVATGQLVRDIPASPFCVSLDFAPIRSPLQSDKELPLAIGSNFEGAKIVNALSGEVMQRVRSNDPEPRSSVVAFSPDGTYLAHALGAGIIEIYDTVTEQVVAKIPAHPEKYIVKLAYSPDGKWLASSAHQQPVKVWDVATGTQKAQLEKPDDLVKVLRFLEDGTLAVALDNGLYHWDVEAEPVADTRNMTYAFRLGRVVAISPAQLVQYEGELKIWDAGGTRLIAQTLEGNSRFGNIAFTSDGKNLAVGGGLSPIYVWDLSNGVFAWSSKELSLDMAMAPDGKTLAAITSPHYPKTDDVQLWTLPAGKIHHDFKAPGQVIAYSSKGLVAVGDSNGQISIYNAQKRTLMKSWRALKEKHPYLVEIAFSPDGSLLASLCQYDGSIELREALTGELVHTLKSEIQFRWFAFSPDGTTLVSSTRKNDLTFWNVQNGKIISTLQTDFSTGAIAFSPDGSLLAMCHSEKRTVCVWNIKTGEEKGCFQNEYLDVALAFSPDGRTLASVSIEGIVRLWDLTRGKWLLTMRVLDFLNSKDELQWLAYNAEGHYFGSENIESKIRWRYKGDILPASRFKATLFKPEKVKENFMSILDEKFAQPASADSALKSQSTTDVPTQTLPENPVTP
jgi:WD40 repeat protein